MHGNGRVALVWCGGVPGEPKPLLVSKGDLLQVGMRDRLALPPRAWEEFVWEQLRGSRVALRGDYGRYLCAGSNSSVAWAARDAPGVQLWWEVVALLPHSCVSLAPCSGT